MKMGNRFRNMYDAATATLFRARGSADVTATTAALGTVTLDKLQGFWTDGTELADQLIPVIVNVNSIDHTTGDETYKLDVVTNNGVVVGSVAPKAIGQYVILVDADTLHLEDPTASTIQINATLSGTTPIINFAAWVGEYEADL